MNSTPTCAAELKGFSVGYRRRRIYDDVDAVIPAGTVALLGPNGAGKTTLMNALVGMSRRTRGELWVAGARVGGKDSFDHLARTVGYLPQRPDFDHRMTVAEHVAYSGWLKGLSGESLESRTSDIIERVNLSSARSQRMGRLSGGMLRRAAIAAALVSSPKLLILDEPTAGLDPAQRSHFKAVLGALATSTNILLATHLVEDVIDLCDHTMVVVDGTFVFSGPTTSLGDGHPGQTAAQRLESGYLATTSGTLDG